MRKGLSILFWLASALALLAAPSVTLDVQPRVIQVGEMATAALQVRGINNPANPGFPPIDGFQIQPAGTESSFSIANGAQDSAVTFKYALIPERPGKFTIGPFTYKVGGRDIDIEAITLEVVATSGAAAQGNQELLFARLEPSTTNLYVQQVFDLVLKVYVSSRVNLAGISALQNLPSQGLVIRQPQELDMQREVVNGEVFTVRRYLAKSQAITAGQFDLAPLLRVELMSQRRRRSGLFGDDMFGGLLGIVNTEPRDVAVQPLRLTIQNLPESGKPASFAGAVGQFTFDMESKPSELTAGDPVTLTFRIAGRGNIDSLQPPALALGDLFKSYEAKLVSQNGDQQKGAGEKIFEQVIMPKSPQATQIPPLDFSFFDPALGTYQTIRRGPTGLVVHPATQTQSPLLVESQPAPSASPNKAEMLGSDIVYLKPAPRHWREPEHRSWYTQPAVLATQAAPAVVLAAALLLVRRREKLAGDVTRARRHLAPRVARAGLTKARAAVASGDGRAYFEALWDAMAAYFGHRLNLSPGEVTSDHVLGAFRSAGMADGDLEWLASLFARCEQARFGQAPTGDATAQQDLLNRLEKLLSTCERLKV